jgi:uncharacterized protein YfaS (alpha-2-macroglobulin family)
MENSDITSSTPKHFSVADLFKRIIRSPFYLLGVLAVMVLIGYSASYYIEKFTSKKSLPSSGFRESASLTVISMSPYGEAPEPDKITLQFSDPIEAHHVKEYFSIDPYIEGELSQGENSREVIFKPKEKFGQGKSYSVRIKSGLESSNDKVLYQEFYGYFLTQNNERLVKFVHKRLTGRVMSFQAGQEIPLTIQNRSLHSKITVGLFRSDEERLMRFLTYYKERDIPDYYYKYGSYISNSSIHVENERIQQFVVDEANFEKKLTLNPGIYYMEAKGPGATSHGSVFLVVSTTGIALRQDDKKIVLSPFDLTNRNKITDTITATAYNLEKTPNVLTSNTFAEIGYLNVPFTSRVDAVIATRGTEKIFIPVTLPESLADIQVSSDLDEDTKIFVYTERPIYKPGDTIFFKGIVRQDSDALYKLPNSGKQVKVWVPDQTGKKNAMEQTLTLDANGTFSGNFIASESLVAQGQYTALTYLYATTDLQNQNGYGRNTTSTYFDVMKYVKPEFDIKVEVKKAEYTRHENPVYVITGKYFDGRPLANTEVDYATYTQSYYEAERAVYNQNFNFSQLGGMCGGGFSPGQEYFGDEIKKSTVKLNGMGTAEVTVEPSKKNALSQQDTLRAWRVDKNKNEVSSAATAIVHAATFNIFFMPSDSSYVPGEQVVIPFYAENLTGEKVVNKEFSYNLLLQSYDSNGSTEKAVIKGIVITDSDGKGLVVFSMPKGPQTTYYNLTVESKDSNGNLAQARKSIYVAEKDPSPESIYWSENTIDQTYLSIISSQSSFKVGDTLKLSIKSPKELDAMVSFERGRIYEPKYVHLNQGDNTLEFTIGKDLSPSITVVFSFFADGKYHSEGLVLNVPAMHMLLDVQIKTDKAAYKVGETAFINVLTRDAYNNPVSANLSLGIVDKAIYALRKNATPPIHSTFYYFRPRRTNASSSLTAVGTYEGGGGRGGRGGGGGASTPGGPAVDTLYWNPNLVTTNGEANISVDLKNFKTTWKIQAIGSTNASVVGQATAEFIVAD